MYKVSFIEEEQYLKSVVLGERKISQKTDGATAWVKIAEYCKSKNVKNLLVISKLTGQLDLVSSYDISSSLELLGLSFLDKIAFVETSEEAYSINSFSKKYTGKVNVEIFNNEPNAKSWLIE